ncbi:flagellar basal body-associated FliL family protein [Melioribacteraceae bacterium 4301-Me]|uniref:flagellar basal body-associated FliL family protein n=1 Tax=Pyranulibacter aquaticus TaxID=3163344 RepID=UPI0035972036
MENEEKRTETTIKVDSQAKEGENPPKVEVPGKKSGFNMKIILFGLPLFILQLVVVYFVTANILLPKINNSNSAVVADTASENKTEPLNDTTHQQQDVIGKYIYSVEDVIVNPAGTNGQKLLLSSLAFDLPRESFQKELQGKEVLVKDKIISILSSKTIDQLSNAAYKDSLRMEISKGVSSLFSDIKINKVYFSKYIIN